MKNSEALLSPQPWNEGGKVHNWRNHIGERTKVIWNTFSDEQKIALFLDAEDRAGNEAWD